MYTQDEIKEANKKIRTIKKWGENLFLFAFIIWGAQEFVFYFTGDLQVGSIRIEGLVDFVFDCSVLLALGFYLLALDKLIDKHCEE